MEVIKENLSSKQNEGVQTDLKIIEHLTKAAPQLGMRVIISGGYAVDGFLGEISRFHNDIDIQIYGTNQNPKEAIEELLRSIDPEVSDYNINDKGRKEYYHNLIYHFGSSNLDIYYLQTKTSPLGKGKHIIKSDGQVDKQEFSEPVYGRIGDIVYEIQNPQIELKDKIYKREVRGDPQRAEHEQDIKNLKTNLSTTKS